MTVSAIEPQDLCLPPRLLEAFHRSPDCAVLAVVGGAVRDLLLHRVHLDPLRGLPDLDLVLQLAPQADPADPRPAAHRLAEALLQEAPAAAVGFCQFHRAFGTVELELDGILLDLASARSIISFADQLEADKIDILICNAGLITTDYQQTCEGLEQTVGVCHFGHFLLTRLLMPRLLNALESRVVLVSSESHRMPKTLDFQRFPLTRDDFSTWTSYGQAKLANVLMANELQRRYAQQGLSACSLHPWTLVTTEIGRGSAFMRIMMKLISPFTKSPNQGAATTVYCAVEPNPKAIGGLYFSHCQPAPMSKEAANEAVAKRLWDLSEAWAETTITSLRD